VERVLERTVPCQKYWSEDTWSAEYRLTDVGSANIDISILGERETTTARMRLEMFLPERESVIEHPSEEKCVSEQQRPLISERFLVVSTEWFPYHGGLSRFNRMLCIALARLCARVACYLPSSSQAERDDASEHHVTLISPDGEGHSIQQLRREPNFNCDFTPTVILGHDYLTGSIAQSLRDSYFADAHLAQVIHTAPGEIAPHKEDTPEISSAASAQSREELQKSILVGADSALCVGPKLYASTTHLLHNAQNSLSVARVDPGFELRKPVNDHSPIPQILLFGRADDFYVKGVDLAAMAMSRINASLFLRRPRLVVRGSRAGEERALRTKILGLAGSLEVIVTGFTTDENVLAADIMRSRVVLMPSRSEGFGLVALEALEYGVPVLVSSESGVAELMLELDRERASDFILPVTQDASRDAEAWAKKIEAVLHRSELQERAMQLRSRLAESLSWENTAKALLREVVRRPPSKDSQLHRGVHASRVIGPSNKEGTRPIE
jgi:glycosyltransferase involved in cell wall biosynthesis